MIDPIRKSLSSLSVILVTCLASLAVLLWWREKPEPIFQRPYDDTEQSRRQKPVWAVPPAHPDQWHPQEKKHRGRERRYWFASLVLSCAVAVGAGFSARYAYKAVEAGRDAVREAQRSTELANRAWLVPSSAVILQFDPEREFSVDFVHKNIGKEPAQNVDSSDTGMSIEAIESRGFPLIAEQNRCPETRPLERGSSMYAEVENRQGWGDRSQVTPNFTPSSRAAAVGLIRSGIKVMAFQYCLAYVSFGKRRTTQVCWYIKADERAAGGLLMLRCPSAPSHS